VDCSQQDDTRFMQLDGPTGGSADRSVGAITTTTRWGPGTDRCKSTDDTEETIPREGVTRRECGERKLETEEVAMEYTRAGASIETGLDVSLGEQDHDLWNTGEVYGRLDSRGNPTCRRITTNIELGAKINETI
jgi:hypothetical protein